MVIVIEQTEQSLAADPAGLGRITAPYCGGAGRYKCSDSFLLLSAGGSAPQPSQLSTRADTIGRPGPLGEGGLRGGLSHTSLLHCLIQSVTGGRTQRLSNNEELLIGAADQITYFSHYKRKKRR